jgi:hypothetical protein
MKMRSATLPVLLVVLLSAANGQIPRAEIPAPAARSVITKRAASFMQSRLGQPEQMPEGRDPFVLPTLESLAPKQAARAIGSDKEMIVILSAQLAPTGSAVRDGESYLLFGQRKVKVGDRVPVVFESAQYELEIVEIDGGAFTVRLNKEEFTRPIKPGKNQ